LEGLDKASVSFKRYSYVSLFGLGTMDQVRSAIVESAQPPDQIGQALSVDSLLSEPKSATDLGWRRALRYAGLVPIQRVKDIAAALEAASFLAVYNYLICIDDLERKGSKLEIKDILGLISYLSEQRQCKVCLILNEDAFGPEERKEFDRFFEKTIDAHVMFAPTAQQCIDIGLPSGTPLNDCLRPYCLALDISNIRVLKKIERLGKILRVHVANVNVLDRTLKTMTLLGWAKYSEVAPSIPFLRLRGRDASGELKENSSEEKTWGPVLSQYGFRYMTSIDEVLCDGVENGFFDEARLREQVSNVGGDITADEAEERYQRAWRRYHDSFNNDADELVEELFSSFKANVFRVTPMNANGTVRLLKDLGRTEQATELIEFYLDQRGKAILDRTQHFDENDISEPEFLKAFDARVAAIEDQRDPVTVLQNITENRGWNREDVTLLATLSEPSAALARLKALSDEGTCNRD
jgi:hypothetical protein